MKKLRCGEVGEVKSAEEFYSFEAKYKNEDSKTIIPAEISEEQKEEIKKIATKAFKAIDGSRIIKNRFFYRRKHRKNILK